MALIDQHKMPEPAIDAETPIDKVVKLLDAIIMASPSIPSGSLAISKHANLETRVKVLDPACTFCIVNHTKGKQYLRVHCLLRQHDCLRRNCGSGSKSLFYRPLFSVPAI